MRALKKVYHYFKHRRIEFLSFLIRVKLGAQHTRIAKDFSMERPYSIFIKKKGSTLEIGKDVKFRRFCSIYLGNDASLKIASGVFFNNYCSITCQSDITIGENTLFGEGVKLFDHNHAIIRGEDQLTVLRDEYNRGVIKIGKNCWISSNVVILRNVEIGDNVVVGAGCLIYKNVPSNAVVKNKTELLISV